jgi:two-component system phosphate regulon sensor histidine kinase PhoR
MSGEILVWLLALAIAAGAVLVIRHQTNRIEAAQYQVARLTREQTDLQTTLAAERTRFDALAAATWDVVLVVDDQRRVVYLNDPARVLFDGRAGPHPLPLSQGEMGAGQSVIEVTRDYQVAQLVADALTGGQPLTRQIVLRPRTFRARAVPFGERDHPGVIVIFQDVSELQRLGRARRDFVANISHELRNPLASIRLLVDTLLGGALDEPEVARRLVTRIGVETDALSQLAQELLDLAQIESGQALMRMVPTMLSSVVEGSVGRLAPQAEQKQLTLRVAIPSDLAVLADAEQVGRVVGNLLHNAIKFTPPGGTIELTAYAVQVTSHGLVAPLSPAARAPSITLPEGDWVVVEVRDTGIGIPARDLPRIFERFYKADQARARDQSGTGLGLAIARHTIEGHGGHIWAESVVGQGATFYFSLPLAEVPVLPPSAPASQASLP